MSEARVRGYFRSFLVDLSTDPIGGSPRRESNHQIMTVDVDYTKLVAWPKIDGKYALADQVPEI